MDSLNERIKELRKENGLTQVQLAEKLGVNVETVNKWETGEMNPDLSLIIKIAALFNVAIDYLVTGKIEDKITLDQMDTEKRKRYLIEKDDVENFIKYRYVDSDLIVHERNSRCSNDEIKLLKLIYEYNSKKIFLQLLRASLKKYFRNSSRSYQQEHMSGYFVSQINGDLDDYIKMCCSTGCLDGLKFIELKYSIIGLETSSKPIPFHIKEYDCVTGQDYTTYTLSVKTLEYAMDIQTSSNEIIAYLSDVETYEQRSNKVYFMADEVASCLYKNGDFERLCQMLTALDANNKAASGFYADPLIGCWYRGKRLVNNAIYYVNNALYLMAYVYPLSRTLGCALYKKDLKWIKLINDYNKRLKELIPDFDVKVFSKHDMDVMTVEFDPSSTLEQIWDVKYVKFGVLDAKSFLEKEVKYDCNSLVSLKKAEDLVNERVKPYLFNHSIHKYELILRSLETKDFKSLFKIAVDSGDKKLDNALVSGKNNDIISVAKLSLPFRGVNNELTENENISLSFFEAYKANLLNSILSKIDGYIEDLTLDKKYRDELEKMRKEISSEYLEEELNEGNIDNVIIKLCVKIEAILKYGYRYQGDLFEMLDQYIKEHFVKHELHNCHDDEDNNYYRYREEDEKLLKERERNFTSL